MTMQYPAYNAPRPQYPPDANAASTSTFSSTYKHPADDVRLGMARTPSPTPSEAKALNEPLFSWKQLTNWRFWIRKEWIKYYIILAVIMAVTALLTIYHHQIVEALTPVTKWLHDLKFGWLVPIGVLFVISFPPLFGHEIVAILCGVVWGLWVGFGIVSAGTFLGEVGNFYAFKYCCSARGEKMERTQLSYACLARSVRTGGFKVALIARFSAIPGHFTTAVFATCGMNIFVFSIAAILSMPKQFITVYLGVILEQSDKGTTTTKSKIISDSVLAVTFLVTVVALWWIARQMAMMKPHVIYERRKARQGKMQGVDLNLYANPNDSENSITGVDIPLTAQPVEGSHPRYDFEQQQKQRQAAEWAAQRRQWEDQQRGRPSANANPYEQQPYSPHGDGHQQWDAQGRAVGYSPGPGMGPVMYAPQPMRTNSGGRTPIQADSLYTRHVPGEAEVHAHGRGGATTGAGMMSVVREGTGDEVGWEMGQAQMQMRQRSPPVQIQPSRQYATSPPAQQQYTTSPPTRQYTTSPPTRQFSSPPARQYTMSPPRVQPPPPEPATPTQAQYATYQPPPSAASTTLAYLKSPFEDPSFETGHQHHLDPSTSTFGHGVEPTGASYHTAYGSESFDSHEPLANAAPPPARTGALSPPPPSYRTNVR